MSNELKCGGRCEHKGCHTVGSQPRVAVVGAARCPLPCGHVVFITTSVSLTLQTLVQEL